jgi:hypothetical protein
VTPNEVDAMIAILKPALGKALGDVG